MKEAKERFITQEIGYLTILASFQHAKIYSDSALPEDRSAVRAALCAELETLSDAYKTDPVADEDHVGNIETLANRLTEQLGAVLAAGRFRIGVAQKALNLYLKYCWCVGRMSCPPPHCPFDRTVIQSLPGCRGVSFTKFDDIETYRKLVAAAAKRARPKSIAEWELELFNDA